jgi:hypothetical protein
MSNARGEFESREGYVFEPQKEPAEAWLLTCIAAYSLSLAQPFSHHKQLR